jgi:hypothetical protein
VNPPERTQNMKKPKCVVHNLVGMTRERLFRYVKDSLREGNVDYAWSLLDDYSWLLTDDEHEKYLFNFNPKDWS